LILNGVVGLILGWAAFPAILVALALQAVFFQFGGITALGVNTVSMALPAVLCYLVFGRLIHRRPAVALAAAFACGFLAVFISGILVGVALMFTEERFLQVVVAILAAHLPVMIIEGIVTALCVAFLRRVQPSMLPGYGQRGAHGT
jgi:cobalt/nickel transport system permease protein